MTAEQFVSLLESGLTPKQIHELESRCYLLDRDGHAGNPLATRATLAQRQIRPRARVAPPKTITQRLGTTH